MCPCTLLQSFTARAATHTPLIESTISPTNNYLLHALFQRFDLNISELHWIVVSGEIKVARLSIFCVMGLTVHEVGHVAQICFKNCRAVRFHPDS